MVQLSITILTAFLHVDIYYYTNIPIHFNLSLTSILLYMRYIEYDYYILSNKQTSSPSTKCFVALVQFYSNDVFKQF